MGRDDSKRTRKMIQRKHRAKKKARLKRRAVAIFEQRKAAKKKLKENL